MKIFKNGIFSFIILIVIIPFESVNAQFQTGDVFVAVANGQVQWRRPNGTLVQTLNTTQGGFTTGMALDTNNNLYVTNFSATSVSKFDRFGNLIGLFGSGYSTPESIVFDNAQNVYVGNLGNGIRKYNQSGTYLETSFSGRVDFMDLMPDQCTMIYTTEGTTIFKHNVCTNEALPNFASGLGGQAYALRISQNGDVFLANGASILRLNSEGFVIQTYDVAGQDSWFALNFDPDGMSFWSANFLTSDVYRFDIATGNVISTFNTGTGTNIVFGLAVMGEITLATNQNIVITPRNSISPINTQQCLTATVTGGNGLPLENVNVNFHVKGINAPQTGNGYTNSYGQVQFCYVGNQIGLDTIIGCIGTTVNCDTAFKEWENSSIIQPTPYTKWISGETSTISWTPLPWANVNIKCIINSGTSVEQPLFLAFQYPGAFNQFPWNIPDTILSYRSKIIIENAANPSQKIESDIFRIKPYLLTRVNPDETYYEYKKDRDQWGFWNEDTQMWPNKWYQQFDYRGIDPFTSSQYSQWQGNSVFLNAQDENFPDWVSWVNTFTTDLCYQNILQANYSLAALNKWNQKKGIWQGSCFGIAISNAIIFRNKSEFFQKYPAFTSFVNPVEVFTSEIVKKTINEIWVHQFGEPHNSYQYYQLNNKTTNQTLQEIRNMLKSDTDPIRILGIINNGGRGGGHAVNVYKLSKDKQNPNQFKVYIYDNNHPDDITFIQVKTLDSNGRGSWSYRGMGGDKFFILSDPANSYLSNPTFHEELSREKNVNLNDSILQVFNDDFQDFVIYDSFGKKSGYVNDTFYYEIPNSIPKMIHTGNEIPPYGFDLRLGNYKINISKFRDVRMKLGIVSGNKSFSYYRNDAINNQTDKLYFDGALSVSNLDTSVKSISLSNILDETTQEKLFAFSSLELVQYDSIKIENIGSDNFKLTSYGSSKSYNIELNLASQSELGRFLNINIQLPSNSSHTFIPNWNNVTTSQLVILQDIGNNGTIDDTLRVSNIITNTEQGNLILPENYSLSQNYPNPFNPSTVIKYDIKYDGLVTLKVYDILGTEVASLVNEIKQAGRYEVEFNGSKLSSGIYYYRLQAGDYSETKKMLLMK